MAERYPNVNKANAYCRDVISGKIDACLFVKQACQRHIDDLKKSAEKSYRWTFDKDKAERVCEFIGLMVHVKGKWAGEFIKLEPWQCFIECSIFGWVDKKTKLRRFTEAVLFVPRKNGKSVIGAGTGNYMLLADNEAGPEIYAGATTERQAWEVFRPAKLMLQKSPGFKEAFGVEIFAKSVFHADSAGRFEPVIGKGKDGGSPHCSLIDEYHEHDTSSLYDSMVTGMGARDQPLIFTITTAGTNKAGPCGIYYDQIVKILAGTIENDRVFGIIYTIDKNDDWADVKNWRKANPNFGVSVNEEYLLHQLETAKQNPSKQNIIRCKHLNQWLTVDTAWMDMLKLEKCKDISLIPESFKHKKCILAVDLASKIDIAAVSILFYSDDDEELYAFGRYYSPRATVDKPGNQHYQTYEIEERLTVTPGEIIDFSIIEEDLRDLCRCFDVQAIAYDPFQATYLATNLSAEGITMVEVRATVQNFSEPMKQLEASIYSGQFHYDACPILTWMFANVVGHYDKKENIYPNKTRNENKIDGVVALIMAIGLAFRLRSVKQPEPQIYFA